MKRAEPAFSCAPQVNVRVAIPSGVIAERDHGRMHLPPLPAEEAKYTLSMP